jgi:glycosyltransferase involved in cell wall biosynthesis
MTERPHAIEQLVDDELQPLDKAVTVVVPAFNEAAHVAEQILDVDRVMRTSGWTYEIIVVDDGSTDGTAQAASLAGVARVVRRTPNRGYGATLKLGVRLASHQWILITDADGTYPVESIPALLAEAPANSMVVGSRTGEAVHVPLARRPAKWFLNRLASYLAGRHRPTSTRASGSCGSH